jgi:Flp pilus assembly protein TadG
MMKHRYRRVADAHPARRVGNPCFRRACKRARDNKGSMAVFAAVLAPVLVAFGALAIDTANYGYRNQLLHQTVHASAIAASNNLGTYYNTGSDATVKTTAQNFAGYNMPSATYGTVVPSSNVVLGNWNSSTSSFTSLASSGGTSPNAVKVTGLQTAANSNALATIFGSMFGRSSIDLSTTVIASSTTQQQFNTIVLNDMSQSFSSELVNVQALDTAILNCVKGSSGSTSKFGITLFNGHSTSYQALTQASTNLASLLSTISALTSLSCLTNCSTGSNIASGIYSAIQQFNSSSYNGTNKNIVIITDGVPNAKSTVNYQQADGIYPTASSNSPTCQGTNSCTDANLLTMAQNQATVAYANGINVSTIYYSGSTASADQAGYQSSLATLRKGSGVSLVAPTSSSISTSSVGFCTTIPSSAKTVIN